ncbi:MAG: PD40 domain-containing protein [Hydrogenophaga sp.]|nr:PD40 domain-containing protein [Hydrogenophaga sp.]
MSTLPAATASASTAHPVRLALAVLGLLVGLAPAHATYPGENGPIVFTSGVPRTIGKVLPGSGAITTLADGFSPRVSPNGRKIAFLKGQLNRGKDVYIMDINGNHPTQLTTGANTYAVTWLPDGSRLAYVAETPPSNGAKSLWTMRPDGTDKNLLQQLTASIAQYSFEWAPAANTIAYSDWNQVLRVEQLATPNARELKDNAYTPSWAPDGKSIVYSTYAALSKRLMEIGADGTDDHALPTNTPSERVVVSPDGTQLGGGFGSNTAPLLLTTRARTGPVTYTWPVVAMDTDWARVPRNCHATTPKGGGGVLAGDVDFYADQCVIAASPDPARAAGVLAQALAVGPDGRVYARSLKNKPAGGDPEWGAFGVVPGLSSGGAGDPAGIRAKKIAVAAAGNGSFQVVIVRADDDALYHAMQYPGGNWSGFARLDGASGAASFAARDVAITINASSATSAGNAQVIANGLADGSLYHRVRWSDGSWSPFGAVPGSQGMNTQALAIAAGEDGNTNVLAITPPAGGGAPQLQQVLRVPNGHWSGWVSVPMPLGASLGAGSDVALTRTKLVGGPAFLMILDATGKAWFQLRHNPDQVASWQGQVPSEPITTEGRTVSLSAVDLTIRILVTRAYPQ